MWIVEVKYKTTNEWMLKGSFFTRKQARAHLSFLRKLDDYDFYHIRQTPAANNALANAL